MRLWGERRQCGGNDKCYSNQIAAGFHNGTAIRGIGGGEGGNAVQRFDFVLADCRRVVAPCLCPQALRCGALVKGVGGSVEMARHPSTSSPAAL